MSSPKIDLLIDEVLSERRMRRSSPSSSFTFNQAAEDLRRIGRGALPPIERAIRQRLVAGAEGNSADSNAIFRKNPGLLNLWMAYFSISAKDGVDDAVRFLRSLDALLLATGIVAIGVTWPARSRAANTCPPQLMRFLGEVAEQQLGVASSAAKRLVGGKFARVTQPEA